MKKIVLLLFFSVSLLSCEKSYLVPENEVPDWLKEQIKRDELVIKDSPQLMNSWGAWMRYTWKNDYYFEYHNVLSESMPKPITANGDTLSFYVFDSSTSYYKEKCCRTYVWKAPEYKEFK